LDDKEPSCIYRVKHIATGRIFAAKRIGTVKKGTPFLSLQMKIGQKIKNQFLIEVVDSFVDRLDKFIVMEYCEGGDMRKFLKKRKGSGRQLCECVYFS
jgi:NIMA (never in mitosis gene a)-related kinase